MPIPVRTIDRKRFECVSEWVDNMHPVPEVRNAAAERQTRTERRERERDARETREREREMRERRERRERDARERDARERIH